MKACPTNALQPALLEAGPEGLWTPMLMPDDRLLRVLLLAVHPGLPDGGHPQAQDRREDGGQDRLRLDQEGPLYPLRPGKAVHRLRGALPDVA